MTGIWGSRGAAWDKMFMGITRPSKRKIQMIENKGGEVITGKCFNCGFKYAVKWPGDKYPKCYRCTAAWGKKEDRRIESHA